MEIVNVWRRNQLSLLSLNSQSTCFGSNFTQRALEVFCNHRVTLMFAIPADSCHVGNSVSSCSQSILLRHFRLRRFLLTPANAVFPISPITHPLLRNEWVKNEQKLSAGSQKNSRFLSKRHRILSSCGRKVRETTVAKFELVLTSWLNSLNRST